MSDVPQVPRPKTYDEGGIGRKQCPKCETYVAARSSACVCGHLFDAGAYKRSLQNGNGNGNGGEVVFFDGPGKGRKQCPGCNKYLGVRHKKCKCGHEFKPRPKVPKVIVFDSPGPNRKKCPDCDKFIGLKFKECICGHKFDSRCFSTRGTEVEQTFTACKSEVEGAQFAASYGRQGMLVTTPAGDCPVKLKDTNYEAVSEWAEKVMNVGQEQGKTYAPSALRYYVRHFYELNTREYALVCENLEEWASQFMSGAA